MSNLVVVGFPKAQEAEEVRRELVTIQQEHLIALEDAVVLEHGDFPLEGCTSTGNIAHYMQPRQMGCLWAQEQAMASDICAACV